MSRGCLCYSNEMRLYQISGLCLFQCLQDSVWRVLHFFFLLIVPLHSGWTQTASVQTWKIPFMLEIGFWRSMGHRFIMSLWMRYSPHDVLLVMSRQRQIFIPLVTSLSAHLDSFLASRSTCWSRKPAGCCSSPSSTTPTVKVWREAPQRLRNKRMAPCPPHCPRVPAPSCPSPSPPTLTSTAWGPALSRKRPTAFLFAATQTLCLV